MADIKKIKINNDEYNVRDATAARKGMYVGTCASNQAALAEKTVTVDTFPVDGNGKPLIGTIIGVKYAASNTYKTDTENNIPEAAHKINVNGTGAILIYYNNAALKSSTSANTIAAGYKNRYIYYLYDGTYWVWINHAVDSNSTYSAMTLAEINAGTGTTGRTLTPTLLRGNFYTEGEVDDLLADKANIADLATVAGSGSYLDLLDTPDLSIVCGNFNGGNFYPGTYNSNYDTWTVSGTAVTPNSKTLYVDVANGYSYIYFANAYIRMDKETVPTKVSDLLNDSGFTTNTGTVTGITMNSGSTLSPTNGVIDLGTVITAHQDISGKADKSTTVTNVSYDSTSKKIQKTINGSTSDVVTLAAVATSGSYNDLNNKPTIPEYVSDLVDDVGLEPELVLGKYTSGNFYVGVKALNTWSFSNIATTPTEGKIYVDVDKGGECYIYVGHGSKTGYFRISGDVSATLSSGNTSAITSNAVYNALEYKADKIAVITNSSTGDVSAILLPNKFYKFGSIDSLALTLSSGTDFVIYAGKFMASADWGGTGLSVPASVTEATNNDTIEAGKTYEFNILDNVIIVKEVA